MSKNLDLTQAQISYLLSPKAIRERAAKVMELTDSGRGHFVYHPEKLNETVDFVLAVIRENYPDLKIPFHSRWGHFRAGGIDRAAQFAADLASVDPIERVRAQLDLVITSVLLDAGAGAQWSYVEETTGKKFVRSEGLGVASYYMFISGVMGGDRKSLRADSVGLKAITEADVNKYFQVSDSNPLVGVAGRVQLLNNLGRAVENSKIFRDGRPGNIVDYLIQQHGKKIPAVAVLQAVLEGFGVIWPGRLSAGGVNLGDVWLHSQLGSGFDALVPIHKLSQWMTYSLIEPMLDAGLEITGVEQLTGLAEYRNGGLLLDLGLLSFRNKEEASKSWEASSDLIIEWRALTVHLLDAIGARVQTALGKSAAEFPLAKVLEGGTWWAGRKIAAQKRAGGVPPLNIVSDGTVF